MNRPDTRTGATPGRKLAEPHWREWLTKRVIRFRRLPVRRRTYLLRVAAGLLAARLAVRLIPFRWLTRYMERPARPADHTFAERKWIGASAQTPYVAHRNEITSSERARLAHVVRWLTNEAAWFLPGQTACLPRAVIAQAVLRRLGVGTTVYYGAATLPERGLTAHAWVQDGTEVIVGKAGHLHYHILACYPQRDLAAGSHQTLHHPAAPGNPPRVG